MYYGAFFKAHMVPSRARLLIARAKLGLLGRHVPASGDALGVGERPGRFERYEPFVRPSGHATNATSRSWVG